jgi:hypothetical protein
MKIALFSFAIYILAFALFVELLVVYKKLSGSDEPELLRTFFTHLKGKHLGLAVVAYLVIFLVVWLVL